MSLRTGGGKEGLVSDYAGTATAWGKAFKAQIAQAKTDDTTGGAHGRLQTPLLAGLPCHTDGALCGTDISNGFIACTPASCPIQLPDSRAPFGCRVGRLRQRFTSIVRRKGSLGPLILRRQVRVRLAAISPPTPGACAWCATD